MTMTVAEALSALLGEGPLLSGDPCAYLADETETRNLVGSCDAVVIPRTVEQVAAVVRSAYANDIALVPRGGVTGYAGGAVPVDGGIVVTLERLDRVRQLDPLLWRVHVDPGAAGQSHLGGNIATNAGGPHTFKYSTTGA